MFEIFALLINFLIVAIVEAMVACYLFSFYLYMWSSPTQRRILTTIFYVHMRKLPREFVTGFFRGNLQQKFAVVTCHENLPWKFGVAICRGFFCIFKQVLLCVYQQILFIWKQTFFIFEQNYFLCEIWELWVTVCYRNLISRTAGRQDNLSEIFHALLHANQ